MDSKERKKVNYEEFFKMAILKLRDTSKSHGIHSVFSGFNQAFREYFDQDPIKVTQELASEGKIVIRPVKRGVMIYLPGEAPRSRSDLGKAALLKIFNKPQGYDKGLIEEILSKVVPNGVRTFPDDFIGGPFEDKEVLEVAVPGTPLELDSNSQTVVISPRHYFRHEAKNPPEAKYIVYATKIGQNKIKIPRNNRSVFRAVLSYEKYCQETRHQCFTLFLKHTNDEDMAELLTQEVEQKLGLRAKRNRA